MVVPYPFRGTIGLDTVLLLSPSQPHMSFPITLDIYPYDGSGKFELTRYSVEVTERHDSESKTPVALDFDFVLQTTCSLPSFLTDIYHFGASFPMDLGYPSKNLVYAHFAIGHSPGLCVLSVMKPSSSASHPEVDGRTAGGRSALTMIHPLASAIDACTLCSTSGRSVYTKANSNGIVCGYVVDYLSPRSN